MKKILPFLLIAFFLTGCSSVNQEEMDALYNAFERNQTEIEADFEKYYSEIEASDDREAQLKVIYEEMIPAIEDFKTTIQNYSVTAQEHKALKEDMLSYIESLKELTENSGEFNRTFIAGNPFDESSAEEVETMLQEIKTLETQVQQDYDTVTEGYENLTAE